jgi:hypothetical protein
VTLLFTLPLLLSTNFTCDFFTAINRALNSLPFSTQYVIGVGDESENYKASSVARCSTCKSNEKYKFAAL